MNRTGLLIALGIAVAVGLVFGLAPELDLKLAGLFHQPGTTLWLGNLRFCRRCVGSAHGWSRWLPRLRYWRRW